MDQWRIAVKDVADQAKAAGIHKDDISLAIADREILDGTKLRNSLIERTELMQTWQFILCRARVNQLNAVCCFLATLGTTHWPAPMPPDSRTTY